VSPPTLIEPVGIPPVPQAHAFAESKPIVVVAPAAVLNEALVSYSNITADAGTAVNAIAQIVRTSISFSPNRT
jgi:hypothetical protein